ncbi:hypothetical protein [Rodentibacter haemolyticus]|uniref:Uncharacterized protein n=1 Tax=Rodentibacter haemolyticus TaxID=2778911 RepID=A0ABX6UZZ3_9PAST|nr:hypothetical protein [Rodentibacter haemolyticus]QPB42661.1 hypothetical protein IHV77_00600 [Rodentibacter haemolyticus]
MSILHRPDDLNHTETVYFCLFTGSFTELENVDKYRFTSGRNYISTFERRFLNGGRLKRTTEHAQNGTQYYRYSIADKTQCETLIKAYNLSRNRRKLHGLSAEEQEALLAKYD